jgi:ribose 5-phosphate isomerase B
MGNKTALGSDHRGLALKKHISVILDKMGIETDDMGVFTDDAADYPIIAKNVAHAVSTQTCSRGILICGSGIGMSIVANKFFGVRAALCSSVENARKSRQHNDANVLVLGQDIDEETISHILRVWFETPFEGGRHQRRLDQIRAIELENFKNTF